MNEDNNIEHLEIKSLDSKDLKGSEDNSDSVSQDPGD